MAILAGGYFAWRSRKKAPPLTDKDVVGLADFANRTGDPVFDVTLRQYYENEGRKRRTVDWRYRGRTGGHGATAWANVSNLLPICFHPLNKPSVRLDPCGANAHRA